MSVAVPVPTLGQLTYSVPDALPLPCAGARVVVPIGPRTLTGVVLGEAAAVDTAFTIKPIKQLIDTEPFVPADVVKLTQWVSDYYLAGAGATVASALPPQGLTARVYRFKDFGDAFAFMCACALRIHALDHHPEWSNVYSTVKVELVTHDAKGITVRDVELASVLERIAKRLESA